MKPSLTLGILAFLALPVWAQEAGSTDANPPVTFILEGYDVDLSEFLWIKRPVVVFADSPFDPSFVQQMLHITDRLDELAERDVVVLTDTDPSAESALRRQLRPRGFMLALIGKDGQVKLRKPKPWDVRELSRTIDKIPMRTQEMRGARRLLDE